LDWQPKYVLVKVYSEFDQPLGWVIFREGEVPFTSDIFRTAIYYRIIARSADLNHIYSLVFAAKSSFSATSG
jgi:hypothetical protein